MGHLPRMSPQHFPKDNPHEHVLGQFSPKISPSGQLDRHSPYEFASRLAELHSSWDSCYDIYRCE